MKIWHWTPPDPAPYYVKYIISLPTLTIHISFEDEIDIYPGEDEYERDADSDSWERVFG